jgi:hypothetical protein
MIFTRVAETDIQSGTSIPTLVESHLPFRRDFKEKKSLSIMSFYLNEKFNPYFSGSCLQILFFTQLCISSYIGSRPVGTLNNHLSYSDSTVL